MVLPQNALNPQKLLAEKGLPQIARIYTDLGGYGILPYPRSQQYPQTSVNSVNSVGELTQPTICVDQCNPWENCIPTEPTEASCREGSPTDSTDLHRFRRVWHPAVPTQPTAPQTSVNSVNSVGELTQPPICVDQCNPWENYIPTEPTERAEVSCREESPTDCTDLHRCRRVWHPAIPTQPLTHPTICVDQCNPWENCIPTGPTEPTEVSCREEPPTDITDAHRCRRVWHPAIPTQPLTQPNFCEFCGFRGRTNATICENL